ncbi:MAG TPA: hypothetical protein VMV10_10205 [Pirellulales bacterium]|nr:hypothetical protein [Pirellulales bacterium]
MAAPQITITLEGNGSVTLRAPQPDIDAPVTVPGVVYRTQGGSLVQYQIGSPYWECTLTIPSMTNDDKNALEAFFRNNWGAAMTYTDENGNTFSVRFLDTGLPLRKTSRDLWTATLHLSFSSILN